MGKSACVISVATLLAAMASGVQAFPAVACTAFLKNGDWSGSAPIVGITPNGGWATWLCHNAVTGETREVRVFGPLSQVKSAFAAAQSVLNSRTPLATTQLMLNSMVTLPETDPGLAAIRADMIAGRGAF